MQPALFVGLNGRFDRTTSSHDAMKEVAPCPLSVSVRGRRGLWSPWGSIVAGAAGQADFRFFDESSVDF